MICDTCNKINRTCHPENKEEKIIKEFCKLIPKKKKDNWDFVGNINKYIVLLAKNNFTGLLEVNKEMKDGTIDDNVKGLSNDNLKNALHNEMKIYKYLMSKHKNKRASQFYAMFAITLNRLIENLADELSNNNVKSTKNIEGQKYADEGGRNAAVKEFCDNISKSFGNTKEERQKLIDELNKIAKRNDGRDNGYTYILNNVLEVMFELIETHRHTRFLRFSEICRS